jgi:hypothetical protein
MASSDYLINGGGTFKKCRPIYFSIRNLDVWGSKWVALQLHIVIVAICVHLCSQLAPVGPRAGTGPQSGPAWGPGARFRGAISADVVPELIRKVSEL